jgi:hypothetical protein
VQLAAPGLLSVRQGQPHVVHGAVADRRHGQAREADARAALRVVDLEHDLLRGQHRHQAQLRVKVRRLRCRRAGGAIGGQAAALASMQHARRHAEGSK